MKKQYLIPLTEKVRFAYGEDICESAFGEPSGAIESQEFAPVRRLYV